LHESLTVNDFKSTVNNFFLHIEHNSVIKLNIMSKYIKILSFIAMELIDGTLYIPIILKIITLQAHFHTMRYIQFKIIDIGWRGV